MEDVKLLKRINELLGTEYTEIYWDSISRHQHLSEDFIREFKDEVWWDSISVYQQLSEDFIREFQNKIRWVYICEYQRLSEDFIREFQDKVWWRPISKYQKLSEDFIREFQDKLHWTCICTYQHLSEGFIREFQDKVYWIYISVYQSLSEDFIREFRDRVEWDLISRYQHLSDKFIKEFSPCLDMDVIKDSWLYKPTEEKKQAVIDTGLYECHDDYFIAYKGVRYDRYSVYNFMYKYEKDGVYETWCDCTADENSFGFSAWTKEKAKDYCDELVIRVKIKYEDVGRVVHNGGKIRCFRLEVLD